MSVGVVVNDQTTTRSHRTENSLRFGVLWGIEKTKRISTQSIKMLIIQQTTNLFDLDISGQKLGEPLVGNTNAQMMFEHRHKLGHVLKLETDKLNQD
jgi:hypothetical protein